MPKWNSLSLQIQTKEILSTYNKEERKIYIYLSTNLRKTPKSLIESTISNIVKFQRKFDEKICNGCVKDSK